MSDDKKEAASIIANTSSKVFMRTEYRDDEAASIIASTNTKIFMRAEPHDSEPDFRGAKIDQGLRVKRWED